MASIHHIISSLMMARLYSSHNHALSKSNKKESSLVKHMAFLASKKNKIIEDFKRFTLICAFGLHLLLSLYVKDGVTNMQNGRGESSGGSHERPRG